LRVPNHLYDAFFNSPVGYRGQFAVSPNQGEKSNAFLIDILMNKLAAAAPKAPQAGWIEASLRGVQAKVWIDEAEVQDHLFDEAPEIDFSRWLHDCGSSVGVRAPLGTRLVVYGGWIDNTGLERINPKKVRRSQEIYECGFS
jgi:hypothetical protein